MPFKTEQHAKPKTHKQVQVSIAEWERYARIARELTEEYGVRVSINSVVKKAVDVYEAERSKPAVK